MNISREAVLLAQRIRTAIPFSEKNPAYLLAVWVESRLRSKLEDEDLLRERSNWRRAAERAAFARRVSSDREKLRRAMTPAVHGPQGNRTS